MIHLNKKEFIAIPAVAALVGRLSKLIEGIEPFNHSYSITHKSWAKNHGNSTWQCSSLIDARDQYWWFGDAYQNQTELEDLSRELKSSIRNRNESAALINAIKILDWGQVYKGCLSYLIKKHEEGRFFNSIEDAVRILESNDSAQLCRFDGIDLRMDSGMTKVYSLASDSSIIFDSRVASAITLIAYRVLSMEKINELNHFDVLSVGKAPNGNKRHTIQGQKLLAKNIGTGRTQARYNLLANWLLSEAIENIIESDKVTNVWGVSSSNQLLRHVESSLFMIGSDISNG